MAAADGGCRRGHDGRIPRRLPRREWRSAGAREARDPTRAGIARRPHRRGRAGRGCGSGGDRQPGPDRACRMSCWGRSPSGWCRWRPCRSRWSSARTSRPNDDRAEPVRSLDRAGRRAGVVPVRHGCDDRGAEAGGGRSSEGPAGQGHPQQVPRRVHGGRGHRAGEFVIGDDGDPRGVHLGGADVDGAERQRHHGREHRQHRHRADPRVQRHALRAADDLARVRRVVRGQSRRTGGNTAACCWAWAWCSSAWG